MTILTTTDEFPPGDEWKALHLPDDPPNLERTVDRVLELLTSAQLLHIDWEEDISPYEKAREIWWNDIEKVRAVLKEGGIPFPCYPLEMYYQGSLYCFLDSRTRSRWFDGSVQNRDEIRHGLRWTRDIVSDPDLDSEEED